MYDWISFYNPDDWLSQMEKNKNTLKNDFVKCQKCHRIIIEYTPEEMDWIKYKNGYLCLWCKSIPLIIIENDNNGGQT